MKTIAITIDDPTLSALEKLARESSARPGSRSRMIRTAVQEYVAREIRRRREAAEREIIKKHRRRLASQAQALISEQAEP
jgi:metal-responsive CopG/Arc/MetJ family transcriptional regulator